MQLESAAVCRMRNSLLIAVVGAAVVLTAGCASTVVLDRAVLAYDTTTAESVSKQLLLNIARVHRNEPMHFTAVSSITATMSSRSTPGWGGP